jgi:hypothetical protein
MAKAEFGLQSKEKIEQIRQAMIIAYQDEVYSPIYMIVIRSEDINTRKKDSLRISELNRLEISTSTQTRHRA